jgi:hypothetical protein
MLLHIAEVAVDMLIAPGKKRRKKEENEYKKKIFKTIMVTNKTNTK